MRYVTALLALTLAACLSQSSPPAPAGAAPSAAVSPAPRPPAAGSGNRVSGPYAHERLAVYLIHADTTDERDFITLDQGLKSGSVKVTEKREPQVNELLLENRSGKPLFIQEGERVLGGKQDRIIGTSFVVPPGEAPVPVPAFCVESGRWRYGSSSGEQHYFAYGSYSAPAPKDVRMAAKFLRDQSRVWREVEHAKSAPVTGLGVEQTNSSLNEMLENKKVKELCEAYSAALASALEGRSDAVGVAFAVGGRVEEVDIYPSHGLLQKMYPRLIQAYAVAAALHKQDARAAPAEEVARLLAADVSGRTRTEKVNDANEITITDAPGQVRFVTRFDGQPVHTQWMRKLESSGADK